MRLTETSKIGPYGILFVCLGNICRSPTAEGVLRQLAATMAPGLHLEIAGLRARQVSPDDFHRFDLILAMDEDNLRHLRALQPATSRAKLQLFLEYAADQRRGEVPDPYNGGEQDFELVLDLTEAAARGLIAALSGSQALPGSTARRRPAGGR
jgi:protein-tyrosine phosphatase